MAYRSTSSSTGSTTNAGFNLPSTTSSTARAIGSNSASVSNSSTNNSTASAALLSAFNNGPGSGTAMGTGVVGAAGAGRLGGVVGGTGLGGNSNQAQAAFMNAGPNRTVSNVGAQAAQGGMGAIGGAGLGLGGYGSPNASNPASSANLADLNLDPSDFPALGSGISNNSAMAPGGPTAASLLSSTYATQASAGGSAGTANNQPFFSNSAAPGSQQQQAQAREFSADDFPALGSASDAHQLNGFPGLNGQSRSSQEQASAAAALAHRQNLLGTMSSGAQNQARSVANAAASTVLQDDALSQKRNYANKLQTANSGLSPYPASSPLPPPSTSPSMQHSPHQLNSTIINGISQTLDGNNQRTSPSLAGASADASRIGSSILPPASIPPQLSSLLLQQHLASQRQQQQPPALPPQQATNLVPQTPAQQVLFSPADRFGLSGLLNIIKMSADPDLGMLTLGTDLGKLGLDVGSSSSLHSSFITPWADAEQVAALNIEPEYQLPSCYNVQPPPASSKIGAFSDETLFFVFYSQPRDAMQEAAAEQLYKRNWRYHKDLHLWLTKDISSEPIQKTSTFERGSYIFFDPNAWEKVQKEFVLVFEHLETRHRGTGPAQHA